MNRMLFAAAAAILGAGATTAAPLACQSGSGSRITRVSESAGDHHQHTHMIWSDGNRSVTVQLDGAVEFSDDDRSVVSLEPGSLLVIDEQQRGEPSRHIEFRGDAGSVRSTYTVNGEVRSDGDADRQSWLARILPELIREQGLNAGPRAERILRKEGVDGLLAEIRRIRSDGVKRIYLRVLFDQARPTPAQTVAALRIIEREISSDGDKASLLRPLAGTIDLADPALRNGFFAAASSISSDGDRRTVLLAALPRAQADAAALTALLESAGEIGSDGDKSSVLVRSADAPALGTASARDAWFRAAGSVSSDGDRSRSLLAILGREENRSEIALAALESARHISSDGDKTRVLLAVSSAELRDARVSAAYDAALGSISSDGDHRRAEQHARSERP